MKNSVAISVRDNVFMSQHIGDLENTEAVHAFHNVIVSLQKLYNLEPEVIAADIHPDYISTKFAIQTGKETISVQHHYAHVVACMAESGLDGSVLGVSWDGTGYGLDGTVWGGEFIQTDRTGFKRVATFRKFRLPGGERAITEPRRTALALLFEIYGQNLFQQQELPCFQTFDNGTLKILRRMLLRGFHSPWTSSVGRLFDGVASLIGLRQRVSFEGQAAMELEFVLPKHAVDQMPFPYRLQVPQSSPGTGTAGDGIVTQDEMIVIDWEPILLALLNGVQTGKSPGNLSAAFHNALVEIIVAVAKRVTLERVVLSGGCFQNKYLTEQSVRRLRSEGFRPYWHQRVPPNDGGIALGQIVAASESLRRKNS